MRSRVDEIGFYGSVAMARAYCHDCKSHAFVIDGLIQCCDRPHNLEAQKVKRMSEAEGVRRKPDAAAQAEILAEQYGRCLYCERELGGVGWRRNRPVRLLCEWDHMVPYSYTRSNAASNFAAACRVCNGIKSDRMFASLDEARVVIALERQKRGYSW